MRPVYELSYYPGCEKEIKQLTKKNKELERALKAKIKAILKNPKRFKPLKKPLAGLRRVHVFKSFVLLYKLESTKKEVVLVKFAHHDEAYK